MGLLNYVLRRILLFIPVLIGVTLITFTISHLVPGDPAVMMAGPKAQPEVVEKIRIELGLNKPLYMQYLIYIKDLISGDLGKSIHSHRQVITDLKEYFPATLELTLFSTLITLLISIPLGVISSTSKDSLPDHLSRFFALVGVATPSFWLGLMLLLVFYLYLDILPGAGRISSSINLTNNYTGLYIIDSILNFNFKALVSSLRHLILPGITQSAYSIGLLTRVSRSSMLDTLHQDYIKTSRAKGLIERKVIYKHALKNALIPIITMAGMSFGYLLGGSVLIETIFSWPGMGRYAVKAITFLDFPAVMGVTVLMALLFVTINLIVDFAYYYIDPRIRYD